MDAKAQSPLAQILKYSGLALPLIAIAVWLAGPHYLITGPSVTVSEFGKRLLIVHALLASTIFLQGCRFQWFLNQKFVGWLLLGAGSIYWAAMLCASCRRILGVTPVVRCSLREGVSRIWNATRFFGRTPDPAVRFCSADSA